MSSVATRKRAPKTVPVSTVLPAPLVARWRELADEEDVPMNAILRRALRREVGDERDAAPARSRQASA